MKSSNSSNSSNYIVVYYFETKQIRFPIAIYFDKKLLHENLAVKFDTGYRIFKINTAQFSTVWKTNMFIHKFRYSIKSHWSHESFPDRYTT